MNENIIAEAIRYSADTEATSSIVGSFFELIAFVVGVLIAVGVALYVMNIIHPRSKRYREVISDLYITAKIRQIAKKEDVDIDSEMKVLAKIDSRAKSFDKVLEERLNEKLLENLEEKKGK